MNEDMISNEDFREEMEAADYRMDLVADEYKEKLEAIRKKLREVDRFIKELMK